MTRASGVTARHRPHADQPHLLVAFDLVGQQHQLRQNRHQQDRQVPVTIEEKLHTANTDHCAVARESPAIPLLDCDSPQAA